MKFPSATRKFRIDLKHLSHILNREGSVIYHYVESERVGWKLNSLPQIRCGTVREAKFIMNNPGSVITS